jgi:GAF domain-containing protein
MTGLPADDAALRRVATLVARQAPQGEVFAAVTHEVADLWEPGTRSAIHRYNPDASATAVAVWDEPSAGRIPVDASQAVHDGDLTARLLRERRAVRVGDSFPARGAVTESAPGQGSPPTVGCPILVQERVWGALVVARSVPEAFQPDTERRISQFAELVAIAVANTEAGTRVQRLSAQQAALRRVATLVAEGAAPDRVFDAVIEEVAQLLGAAQVGLARYESGLEISVVAML